MSIVEYYKILGLKPNASIQEVKQAYRNLAKIWHPDRFINNHNLKQEAEEKIKIINLAYDAILASSSSSTKSVSKSEFNTQKINEETFYQQGVSYAEKEEYHEAIAEFSQAIKLDSNYLAAYQYRGFILAKLGYEYRANSDFRKVAELKLKQPVSYSKSNYQEQSKNKWRCFRTILSHQKNVASVAISPDSKYFATGSYDKNIKLWELRTGQIIYTFKGHTDRVNSLLFRPDSQTLISSSRDRTIKLWNIKARKIIRTLGTWFNGHKNDILTLAIDGSGQNILSGSGDKTIKIWNIDQGKIIQDIQGCSTPIFSIAVSPDGSIFASSGLEKQLRIRDIKTGKVIRSIRGKSGVLSLSFSPDGTILATGGFDRIIRLWDWKTGKEIGTLTGHLDRISAVIFSDNGKMLVSSSWDNKIKLWQLETGKEICTLREHTDKVSSIAIAPNGKTIVSGSADHKIKIWQRNN